MTEANGETGHPFLATLAVRRTGSTSELPGRYCGEEDVWVIDGRNGPTPIVVSHKKDSVAPVTKIKGERDEFYAPGVLELSTKTYKQLERDDTGPYGSASSPESFDKCDEIHEQNELLPYLLLELSTKTEKRPERDD
jgi:hypothetical protein